MTRSHRLHRRSGFAAAALSTALLAAGCADQPTAGQNFAPSGTAVYRAPGSSVLSAGSFSPTEAVDGFLRDRGRSPDGLTAVREAAAANGLTHVRFAQMVEGLRVVGADARAAFDANGNLVDLIDHTVDVLGPVAAAEITAQAAIDAALGAHYPDRVGSLSAAATDEFVTTFERAAFFHRAPTVTRVAMPVEGSGIAEAYLVETWTAADNMLLHTLVDGAGNVVDTQVRTNADSYNIFPDHPGNSSQTVVAGPGAGNAESPAGWLAGSQRSVNIRGNNVHAYLDRDANNSPDAGGASVGDGNFLTAANLSSEPTTAQNQEVAIQNLFYFNNVIHDKLYRHGFVEGTGNFQNDNFGRGGAGGDAVNAEAQDGSGTNNANFATPSDGSPGRMQMYLWTVTSPGRDGDVDSDIIWHEYGHGLTWRMIGNMSGPMSGAIGEGMADVLSILVNEDDVVGEYSTGDPVGIRSEPYTGYSRTYGDFGGSSVHFDGEIYAATIWRLYGLFQEAGIAKDTLFDYLIGGMNFTPSGPAMEDMRDGILAQVGGPLEPGSHACLVWEAFAASGIGVGANATVKQRGPYNGSVSVSESFAVPAGCSGGSCTPTESFEVSCGDGVDNDCDGAVDAADADCDVGGSCEAAGASCTSGSDCCSGNCKGPRGRKTCK